MTDHLEDPEGVSRRQILKKAAVAGAVVWATPVIQTINPAHAYAGTPNQVCYSVSIAPDGSCSESGEPGGCGQVGTGASGDGSVQVSTNPGATLVEGYVRDSGKPGTSGDGTNWVFQADGSPVDATICVTDTTGQTGPSGSTGPRPTGSTGSTGPTGGTGP